MCGVRVVLLWLCSTSPRVRPGSRGKRRGREVFVDRRRRAVQFKSSLSSFDPGSEPAFHESWWALDNPELERQHRGKEGTPRRGGRAGAPLWPKYWGDFGSRQTLSDPSWGTTQLRNVNPPPPPPDSGSCLHPSPSPLFLLCDFYLFRNKLEKAGLHYEVDEDEVALLCAHLSVHLAVWDSLQRRTWW